MPQSFLNGMTVEADVQQRRRRFERAEAGMTNLVKHAVARRFLPRLAAHTPLLPGADTVACLDLDDTTKPTHGYAKQGVGYGYNKVKGL